jgi:hypothetical protein
MELQMHLAWNNIVIKTFNFVPIKVKVMWFTGFQVLGIQI